MQQANGGNRLITGFAFDPRSTPTNPIIWVSNSFYALSGATNGVDFTGKITVMSGPDLATVQDAVINLPRSVADHVTDQPVFGPDGALYFAQAATMRLARPTPPGAIAPSICCSRHPAARYQSDHARHSAQRQDARRRRQLQPVRHRRTADDLRHRRPQLRLICSGIRNGNLCAPTNGSSAGGNAPAFSSTDPNQINGNRIDTGQPYTGPNVPALTNIQQTEDDYLYKIVQGGYYGHPNPDARRICARRRQPHQRRDPTKSSPPIRSARNPDANYRGYEFRLRPAPLARWHHSISGQRLWRDAQWEDARRRV